MNMKTGGDIDLFLESNGLKYILEYLNHIKKGDDSLMLPAIDVLRMIPDFEAEVKVIREKYQIDWKENINKIGETVGMENLKKFLHDLYKVVLMVDLPINNTFFKVDKYLTKYKNRYYPDISKDINRIKKTIVRKIQPIWYEDIEIYIIFNICKFTPYVFSRPSPEVNIQLNKKTKEKYIEVKIYSDSDLNCFNKKMWGSIFSEVFPDRIEQERLDNENSLRRFLHYVLRIRGKFKHTDIYSWLSNKKFSFDTSDYAHASQEIQRFREAVGLVK